MVRHGAAKSTTRCCTSTARTNRSARRPPRAWTAISSWRLAVAHLCSPEPEPARRSTSTGPATNLARRLSLAAARNLVGFACKALQHALSDLLVGSPTKYGNVPTDVLARRDPLRSDIFGLGEFSDSGCAFAEQCSRFFAAPDDGANKGSRRGQAKQENYKSHWSLAGVQEELGQYSYSEKT